MGEEVGTGEIDDFLALLGNRDPRHDDVAVAVVERGEDAVPGRVDELHFKAAGLGDFLHQVDVEADEFLVGGFVFEGTVGRSGADHVFGGLSKGRGESTRHDGGGEKRLELHGMAPRR